MLITVVLAGALLLGAPFWLVAVAAVTFVQPWFGVAAVGAGAAVALRGRIIAKRAEAGAEARFCTTMAEELRAGASLRVALQGACQHEPSLRLERLARQAAAGLPMDTLARRLEPALPRNGKLAAAALVIAADTGASGAAVFDTLGLRAVAVDDVARERRTATAQARLSALVVGAAPVLIVAALLLSGRASALLEAGAVGWVILSVGLALEVAGLALVGLMLWRAAR